MIHIINSSRDKRGLHKKGLKNAMFGTLPAMLLRMPAMLLRMVFLEGLKGLSQVQVAEGFSYYGKDSLHAGYSFREPSH